MPTSTFFRLPEEKRERLMEACWSELTRVRFTDLSINRIIAAAHIPRGSFYQYFTDKEELVRYLLEDMRQYFVTLLREILTESKGDLFSIPLGAFDRFVQGQGATDPILNRFIQVLRLNQGIDTQAFLSNHSVLLPDPLWELVDTSLLKCRERSYADHVFHLVCAVLAFSVMETLREPGQWQCQREILQTRMDLLRYGSAAPDYKEERA